MYTEIYKYKHSFKSSANRKKTKIKSGQIKTCMYIICQNRVQKMFTIHYSLHSLSFDTLIKRELFIAFTS